MIVTGAAALAVLSAGLPAAQAASSPGWRVAHDIKTANTALEDIVATSPTSAWATGGTSTQTPVVYRWQHGRWRAIARPGPTGSFAGNVSATSDSNVWVTLENESAVDHWDGHRWIRKSFAAAQQILVGPVITPARRDAWVLTENSATKKAAAEHYNGRTWTAKPLPIEGDSGSYADSISSSSAANIWAWAYDSAHSDWAMLHYNGSAWRVVRLPAHLAPSGVTLLGEQVVAESRSDVWATVDADSGSSPGPVILLHWNGHQWRKATGRLPAAALVGPIASDGHGGLWLVSQTKTSEYFEHYRAGTWTRQRLPAVPGGAVSMTALALIPGTRSVWGTGTFGPEFEATAGAVILKYGS
jgi:hypothetical protein